jgi:hypothetical protein
MCDRFLSLQPLRLNQGLQVAKIPAIWSPVPLFLSYSATLGLSDEVGEAKAADSVVPAGLGEAGEVIDPTQHNSMLMSPRRGRLKARAVRISEKAGLSD